MIFWTLVSKNYSQSQVLRANQDRSPCISGNRGKFWRLFLGKVCCSFCRSS